MPIHIDNISLVFEPEDEKYISVLDSERFSQDDIYLYSGEIHPFCDRFVKDLIVGRTRRKNCTLILTTPGGDADAAYKIARLMQTVYDRFTLIVPAECKSAGTLLALGATEIAMEPFGELGPLDVQVFDPDEFLHRTSGLAISQSLDLINEKAFAAWEAAFMNVRARSLGIITTATASEIATSLVTGLYSKITDKIDPSRLGELQRSTDVAKQYGIRLGADEECVKALIEGYPSHSFVIDHREAKELFGDSVRLVDKCESMLLMLLTQNCKSEYGTDFVHRLSDNIAILSIDLKFPEKPDEVTEEQNEDLGNEADKHDCSEGASDSSEPPESGVPSAEGNG